MKKLSILLFVLLVAFVSCTETNAAAPKKEEESSVESLKQTVLFFMNPHGRPCQIQDSIITDMGDAFSSKASVHYVKTTERATAMPLFQKYGVRALPTLIVLDEKGNEKKRFSPGIQGSEQLSEALR